MLLFYKRGFENSILFTCAYCGLVAPKTDLTYFLTSNAVSTNPVAEEYNVSFLAILELLMLVYAVATAVFFIVRSAILAWIVATCKSVSFGV
jgi:hypothetical protein